MKNGVADDDLEDCMVVSYNAGEGRVRNWITQTGGFVWKTVKDILPAAIIIYRNEILGD